MAAFWRLQWIAYIICWLYVSLQTKENPAECNCETQPPASIGSVALSSMFVVRPASVTPPLISTIWCFRPYKPYIFREDMILPTCQCHILGYITSIWVSHRCTKSCFTMFTFAKTILETCDIWDTDYNSDNWEPHFRQSLWPDLRLLTVRSQLFSNVTPN